MSDTPNHEYNVPDEGEEDWHVPLNENFETLEVDIELRDEGDPDSNGYQPTDGAKYLDTLNGLVYLANGSTWNQVFSFGGGGGGISSLSGGGGIDPGTIGDGDTLSVAWGDANDLDTDGNVTGGGGGGISSLSGGGGIDPGTIGDGDTLSVAWGDANDLDADGNVTGGGSGGISGLSGGDGINPGTIGDGDTLTAAWSDAASLDSNGDIADFSSAASLDSNGDIADFSSAASLDSNGTVDAGRYLTTSGGQVDFTGPAEWSNAGNTGTNTVSGIAATVAGGERHEATGDWATISGGDDNLANATEATVAGGFANSAEAEEAAVGGGEANTASGQNSTVPGGEDNTASGNYSFAAGRAATANNDGSFVVGDSTSDAVSSQNPDEARFQTSLISESFIETGFNYYFDSVSMFLEGFQNSNNNETVAISVPGPYGIGAPQLEVVETGQVTVPGDFDVGGNKNFVESVETDEGEREVVYTASEAAEARTEASGVADVEDGRAVIELPDHFGWVTSDDEPLVVQTTPCASEPVQPQVTERSTDRIVIEDFAGVDEYEVAYTVKGTRAGQEDKQVVREPTATGPSPAPADDD